VRRKARVDGNQQKIVDAFKSAGASVQSLASLGNGVPDLLVGYRGVNFLVEVKDPAQPPSKRALTDDQIQWTANWRGQWVKVEWADDAIDVIKWVEDRG
jgi:phage I-like protein